MFLLCHANRILGTLSRTVRPLWHLVSVCYTVGDQFIWGFMWPYQKIDLQTIIYLKKIKFDVN